MRKTDNRKPFKLSVLATALALIPLGAHAAGLGRLTVNSALGQPLRAEIEVTANRDELSSLSARLASPDAFKNAGIEYVPALSGLRFAVDKRPNGQVFIVASSDRPFNEPFVDVLVEMNWASGRLVREYTFLLDPPEIVKRAETPAPAAVPEVRRETVAPAVPPAATAPGAQAPAAAAPAGQPQAAAPAPSAAQPAAAGATQPAAAGATREVVKGDTLGKIAGEIKPADVNLDQMLAALFLSNKDVFDGGNMNRLRAGKILKIPDSEAIAAVEPAEARKMVVAQAADFNAYRKKLAAAVAAGAAKEEAPKQAVAGKITPKVEEKAPPAAGKDKLEVSRTEAGKGAKGGKGASEADLIARDKEIKEANERIAALEKNIADLKKLSEMKGGAKPEAPAPAKPAEPPKPALAVPAKPVEAPKPAEAPMPAAKPAPKPLAPPPPPPSFMEEHPEIVFGGGAIVALLLGYLGYNAWRRKREAAAAEALGAAPSSSVFGTAAGTTVDTGAALPTDFSQQPDAEGDEGVDPVAEADVYIAYGRDTQAEEILLEALKTDPTRTAIHVKLLEIYAARKDIASFESVARELYGLTGGAGTDWERAQLLGRSIDPTNPLYGGSAAAAPAAEPEGLDMTSTIVTSSAVLKPAAAAPALQPAPPPAVQQAAPAEELPASLDFDLDLGAAPEAEAPTAAQPAPAAEESTSLDFDLGSAPEAEAAAHAAEPEAAGLDFELDMPAAPPAAAEAPAQAPAAAPAADSNALDFDFDLSEPSPAPAAEPAAALQMPSLDIPLGAEPAKPSEAAAVEPEMPPLDLSGIDLSLEEAPAAPQASAAPPMPETTVIVDDPEVATKLELAQAYEEMGDKEGARELLNEVLNEGSPAQQDAARQKLAALA